MAPTNLPLRLVKKLTFRSARSNVQQFFDETTRTSLQSNLEQYLYPPRIDLTKLEINRLLEIFEACAAENASNQQCWNEESFSKFLGIKHPEIAISKDLVHLLWKIFQYYAHHPFAPKSSEETIDANGFRRAILLLHLRRTERLGTLEYDYHWKMQNESIMNGNVERVFRIIGQPYIKTNLNDVMDVLASVQPTLSFCELPSPGQVEATARRLICKESTQPPFQIARKDITSLMSLLLRMKVSKTKPKTLSPQGYFEPADSTHDEMAQILVNKMIGREVDFLQSDQINQSLTSLPNFYGRFQLLWATLFQLWPGSEIQTSSKLQGSVPSDILGVFSLILLPLHFNWSHPRKIDPYVWETGVEDLTNSNDISDAYLIECLVKSARSRLMLITSTNETSSSLRIMWGIYFVGPLWVDSSSGDKCLDLKATTAQYIFQIKPEFHWIKGMNSETPLSITQSDGSTASNEFEQKCHSWKLDVKGGSDWPRRTAEGIHARLDLNAKSVVLFNGCCDEKNRRRHATFPGDVFFDWQSSSPEMGWEVSVGFDKIQILSIPNGGNLQDGFLKRDDPRYTLNTRRQTVSYEEIKSRIQGFGSTSKVET